VFDLKGSYVSRGGKLKGKVFKDCDFLELKQEVCLGQGDREFVLEQLKKDAELLCGLGIMDYSVLLCLAETKDKKEQEDDQSLISNG